MKIAVTEIDIMLGKPMSAKYCAIALACKRAGLGPVVIVIGDFVHTYDENNFDTAREEFRLPDIAKEFLNAFDNGENVLPFCFELDDSAKEPL